MVVTEHIVVGEQPAGSGRGRVHASESLGGKSRTFLPTHRKCCFGIEVLHERSDYRYAERGERVNVGDRLGTVVTNRGEIHIIRG